MAHRRKTSFANDFMDLVARLTEWDVVGDGVHRPSRAIRLARTLAAVVLEPVCAVLGTLDQRGVLVADLATQC